MAGKESARFLCRKCAPLIKEDKILILNMAGVKDITPGFSQEAFGNLYLLANKRGGRIKFENADANLNPIILQGIRNAIRI